MQDKQSAKRLNLIKSNSCSSEIWAQRKKLAPSGPMQLYFRTALNFGDPVCNKMLLWKLEDKTEDKFLLLRISLRPKQMPWTLNFNTSQPNVHQYQYQYTIKIDSFEVIVSLANFNELWRIPKLLKIVWKRISNEKKMFWRHVGTNIFKQKRRKLKIWDSQEIVRK